MKRTLRFAFRRQGFRPGSFLIFAGAIFVAFYFGLESVSLTSPPWPMSALIAVVFGFVLATD